MLDAIIEAVTGFGNAVLALFPKSPFSEFINGFDAPEYLGWLNWFIPVSQILGILSLWLAAVALFYLWSVVARWVKIIGD